VHESPDGPDCSTEHSTRTRADWATILGLVFLTAAVYWPVLRSEFVNYDDPDYITSNEIVQRGWSRAGLAWAFGQLHGQATYWHPLTWLTHMLDCQLYGLNSGAHHLTSLVWHTLNTVLLFVVARRMTGTFWQSALLATFFSVHPLQVESVAWVSERKNLLSAFFFLLMLWAYVRHAERPALSRYWPVPVFFAFGLMAKPIVVTLAPALLLLDFWPLGRLPWKRGSNAATEQNEPLTLPRFPQLPLRRLVLEKVPLLILALGAGLVALSAHHGLGMLGSEHGLSMKLRLENGLVSYGRYVGKALWPSDLCAIYPHPGQWPVTTVAGSALFITLVSGWTLYEARRRPYLLVGWLWFLSLLLPTIGILQVGSQAMADRFVYLPITGLFIVLIWGLSDLLQAERRGTVIRAVVAGSALAACAITSSFQLRYWRNSVALYERAIEVTSDNFVAHSNLGYTLEKEGELGRAVAHLVEALRIRPEFAEARYQMGLILGRVEGAEAAVAQYREVVRLDPNWSLPRLELAKALVRLQKPDEAMVQLVVAKRLTSDNPDVQSLLAMLLAARRETAEAIRHYREALRLKPDWPDVLNNLAWLLATNPQPALRDGAEAVRLARRACELTHDGKAMYVGTLAAAYGEAGRFADAVEAARKARALALASGEEELAATNSKLLDLYQQGKSYHETP